MNEKYVDSKYLRVQSNLIPRFVKRFVSFTAGTNLVVVFFAVYVFPALIKGTTGALYCVWDKYGSGLVEFICSYGAYLIVSASSRISVGQAMFDFNIVVNQ